jgi:Domain of unknown function (DUF397)
MKSSSSSTGNCVDVEHVICVGVGHVAAVDVGEEAFIVVDTKMKGEGPKLVFNRKEWDAFVAGVKAGEFDFDLPPET